MPLKLQALKCCYFCFLDFISQDQLKRMVSVYSYVEVRRKKKKRRTWNGGSIYKEIRLFYYFAASEVKTAKLNIVPSLCCFRYQA